MQSKILNYTKNPDLDDYLKTREKRNKQKKNRSTNNG